MVPLALPLQRISREGGRRLRAGDRPAAAAGTATHRYNLARFVVRSKPRGASIATQTEPDLGVWATEALCPAKGGGDRCAVKGSQGFALVMLGFSVPRLLSLPLGFPVPRVKKEAVATGGAVP